MTPQRTLRPDLVAVCLFAKQPVRRERSSQPMPRGVLAELARQRFYN